MTVLCDGTVTCGLDDPFKVRRYGNLHSAPLREILADQRIEARRMALQAGRRCDGCTLHTEAAGTAAAELTPSRPYPRRLILEPSIRCNIRCRNDTCDIANDAGIRLRTADFMPWDLYCRLIAEAGPHLRELHFYHYGEPFAHPQALEMLAFARGVNPALRITTSTNGIALARPGKVERIVGESLLDDITFTISGIDRETYIAYHRTDAFDKAMAGMRRLTGEKRRRGGGRPNVHWRCLLFNWNDTDEHIAAALRLREETGVDEFRFMLTAQPLEGRSLRRAPGTRGFEAIRPWLAYQEGYAADPFAEAGLWGPEQHWATGPFSWTGKRASVLATPRQGVLHLRLGRFVGATREMPAVRISAPWGEFAAQAGRLHWHENRIPVPNPWRVAPASAAPIAGRSRSA